MARPVPGGDGQGALGVVDADLDRPRGLVPLAHARAALAEVPPRSLGPCTRSAYTHGPARHR